MIINDESFSFGENSHFTDIRCLKKSGAHDYLTFYCPENFRKSFITVNQIFKIIILTPPIVIPSIRAMYGFLHPPIWQNTLCKWEKIHFTMLNLLKLNTCQHLPMALLRMYSSRKKSSARASPAFPASVTAESLKDSQDVNSKDVGGSCLKTHFSDWAPRCSPLMSPPAQKAFPPAPLMITMAVSLSSSHFYF